MQLDKFTDECYAELISGNDQIVIGTPATIPAERLNEIIDKRRAGFESLASFMNKMSADRLKK
jgi:hypothetical protein